MMNEAKIAIQNADEYDSNLKQMGQMYFETSENAEKFIHNYQQLKMNIELPWDKRRSLHASMLATIG